MSPGAVTMPGYLEELLQVLFVGDDWAEDHHDVEVEDEDGHRLARARLPEGLEGIARLHALVAEHAPSAWAELAPDQAAAQVVVGIETDRGPWVTALRAAGYQVFAINPLSAARYRQRHSTSGAKSDVGDAHVLAEIVRLDRDHHRPIAGDSDLADAIKLLARAHQTAIWERTRQVLRLRSTLLQYFPAAVQAFEDLSAPDALALLSRAADPDRGAKLTRGQLVAALRTARRHDVEAKADVLQSVLRAPALRQPLATQGAYAAVVSGQLGIITALNAQIKQLGQVVGEHFGRHPAAEIYLSQPGLGVVLAARTLGEFGDDTARFTDARCTQELLRAEPDHPSLRQEDHRAGPLRHQPATRCRAARAGILRPERLTGRTGYYDAIRARNIGHHAALRQLANRLVGILHGCLKTGTLYNESTAWQHRTDTHATAASQILAWDVCQGASRPRLAGRRDPWTRGQASPRPAQRERRTAAQGRARPRNTVSTTNSALAALNRG